VVVIAVVVIIGGLLLIGSRSNNSISTVSRPQSNTIGSRRGPGDSDTASKVMIHNLAFDSANIAVKVGTKVTWTNQDPTAHTVTGVNRLAGLASPVLNHGQTYSFTFNRVGVYRYHCTIHPAMEGIVRVTH
jgi:amicyanin